jgi:predicted ATPase
MEIQCLPEEIYSSRKKKDEFSRTISRLTEMNSEEYL